MPAPHPRARDRYAPWLEKLKSICEGEQSLLDSSTAVLGSGISDGDTHKYQDLPVIVAGKAVGKLKTGEHLSYLGQRPLADLWHPLLTAQGVASKQFADSSKPLSEILVS